MTRTPILLHPSEPRCELAGCRMRLRCARAMAPAGQHEVSGDWQDARSALCSGLLSFEEARRDAGAKYAAAAKAKLA